MRNGSILDDALNGMKQNCPTISKFPVETSENDFKAAMKSQNEQCTGIALRKQLVPAKAEMTLDHNFRVTNAQQVRHLEDNTLALERDVATPVRLVYEAGLSYFETDDGVRMDINDPSGTLGSPKELDSEMKSWMAAFENACDSSRRGLPFPARTEMQIEWRGELRLTSDGRVLWKPEQHPDYSSVEGLCDALISVWVVMGA